MHLSKILSVNFLENEAFLQRLQDQTITVNEQQTFLKAWLKIRLWCYWQRNFFTAVTEHFKIIIRIKTDNIWLWHIRFLGIPIISRVSKTFPPRYSLRMFITTPLRCFPCSLADDISLVSLIFLSFIKRENNSLRCFRTFWKISK